MISVLVPTRKRPELLERSLASLIATSDVGDLEILLALDPDDEVPSRCVREPFDSVWVAPERYGYARLNEYFNALAARASGDWIMLWNDDAVMLTPGWDAVIEALPANILVADLYSEGHSPMLCTFPVIRREAIEVVGGMSPYTQHCDTYWQEVGRLTGTIQYLPDVQVRHDRFDMTGCNDDDTYREGRIRQSSPSQWESAPVQNGLARSVRQINEWKATRNVDQG